MNLVQDELREAAKDSELARIYAKKNCRHCRGTGFITRSFPVGGQDFERRDLCQCVARGIKKAMEEVDG